MYLPKKIKELMLNACMRCINRGTIIPRQNRWGKLRDVIEAEGHLERLYQVSYALFTREFLGQLSKDERVSHSLNFSAGSGGVDTDGNLFNSPSSNLMAQISNLELRNFVGQRLVRDTDCASMAVSLEVREPLLDHRLIEELARIEPALRFYPIRRKMLLRSLALSEIDPKIFDRPKSGFVLPIEKWMKNTLRKRIAAVFADQQLAESVGLDIRALGRLLSAFELKKPEIYWSRVWALYVLMWWAKHHNVRI